MSMSTRNSNSPQGTLLDTATCREALGVAAAIAEDLAGGVPPYVPSLARGNAELALVFSYLHAAMPEGGYRQPAESFMDAAIDALAHEPLRPALLEGFLGVAWIAEHLQRMFGGSGGDVAADIDDQLVNYLECSPWTGSYDLVRGLVGCGVYALERFPRPVAVRCLELVVDQLGACACERPEGISWHTSPEQLSSENRERYPDGYFDIGMAHGVAGVIALLGGAAAAGVAADRAGHLLAGAVRWLLAQRLPPKRLSRFGYSVGRGSETQPIARAAWCYGDPGVALGLLVAARVAGNLEWADEAHSIARHASRRRTLEQTAVEDACLCHGSAGLAVIYRRFHESSAESGFADAHQYWIEQTLAMRRPGVGIGGYRFVETGSHSAGELWRTDVSVLTGASGVALALLSAATGTHSGWDRLLMASVAPGR